jgi:cytochrome c-type biogenesis protein CcmH/NrfG
MSDESVQRVLSEAIEIVTQSENPRQHVVDHLEACIEAEPQRARLWSALGASYSNNGQHKEALEAFRKAVQLRPQVICYKYELISELITHGELEEAEDLAQGVVNLRPWDIDAKRVLADVKQAIMERPAESR